MYKERKINRLLLEYSEAETGEEARIIAGLRTYGRRAFKMAIEAFVLKTVPPLKARLLVEKLCYPSNVKEIIPLLASPNIETRQFANHLILGRRSKLVTPLVMKYLRHSDAQIRTNAAELLYRLKDESSVPALAGMFGSADDIMKMKIVKIAGAAGGAAAGKLLKEAMNDRQAPVRIAVIKSLERNKGGAGFPSPMELLKDKEAAVRREAVRALGRLGDRGALPALKACLLDPDETVRCEAVLALEALETEK